MRLMNGAWIARIVHTAAEIGIVDHLDDQPRHAQWLASASGTHAPSLARLLRALAAIGIVAESDQRQYTLTPVGAMLRGDAPRSMRGWARMILSEMDERPWQALTHSIRTGEYAFYHAFWY
jgi:DNA-binding IclR family transcriptional regulator